MNIKELKKIIEDLPDYMEVAFNVREIDGDSEFSIEPIQRAKVENIRFSEGNEPGTDPQAYMDCLVLSTLS